MFFLQKKLSTAIFCFYFLIYGNLETEGDESDDDD